MNPILNTRMRLIAILVARVKGDVRIVANHEYSIEKTTLENVLAIIPSTSNIPILKPPEIHPPHLYYHITDPIDEITPDNRERQDKDKSRFR